MKKVVIIKLSILLTFLSLIHFISTKSVFVTLLSEREMALEEKDSFYSRGPILEIPLLKQMDEPHLKNGCEVTSLAMILNDYGIMVSKNELADRIKKVPLYYSSKLGGNPNIGFVGSISESPGFGVYNGPIYDLLKEYVGSKAVNLTGHPFEDLLDQVNKGNPVWIISTKEFKPGAEFIDWNTPQGKIKVTLSEHSAVITGFDQNFIYINDPYGYKNKPINRLNFINAWKEMGSQAVLIEK